MLITSLLPAIRRTNRTRNAIQDIQEHVKLTRNAQRGMKLKDEQH